MEAFIPCLRPLKAYRTVNRTENGKAEIVFRQPREAGYTHIDLPCGQCISCRIDRSKSWALRCMHEAQQYDSNCFITLTFNDENINKTGTLIKSDFQKFMKRLRKKFKGHAGVKKDDGTLHYPIRFFHCGEYGSQLGRPHHHACLFNFDFDDKELWSVRDNVSLYRSCSLEQLWPFGFSTIGSVTFESCAYVARYITKKISCSDQKYYETQEEYYERKHHYSRTDESTGELIPIEPEYITMSRRPGIGKRWFEQYRQDVYPSDFITHKGKKFKPPRYYDKLYDEISPDSMETIKKERKKNALKHKDNNTPRRLSAREKVLKAKTKKLIRSYENG